MLHPNYPGRTNRSSLKHKFPYDRVCDSLVQITLTETGMGYCRFNHQPQSVKHKQDKQLLLDSDHPEVAGPFFLN